MSGGSFELPGGWFATVQPAASEERASQEAARKSERRFFDDRGAWIKDLMGKTRCGTPALVRRLCDVLTERHIAE